LTQIKAQGRHSSSVREGVRRGRKKGGKRKEHPRSLQLNVCEASLHDQQNFGDPTQARYTASRSPQMRKLKQLQSKREKRSRGGNRTPLKTGN